MSHQYQPTEYYSWPDRNHGIFLDTGDYVYIPYDYYGGDEIQTQNIVFRNSQYTTFDNTHLRFLNKSDLHLYDTTDIKIFDSGTITMHTSASKSGNPPLYGTNGNYSRSVTIDEYGRLGIGMWHQQPHSNRVEAPSFDLDVRGSVGVEDFIYHNDDTDTYMLFGADETTHYVNNAGDPDLSPTTDYDEINFRAGGIDMIQMLEDGSQDHITLNKRSNDVDLIVRSVDEPHMVFVDAHNNRMSIGDSEDAPTATLEITNSANGGAFDVPLVQLNNKDTDKQLLDINADNIDADVISVSADALVSAHVVTVTADSLTTGDVFNATADNLTTGSLLHMTHAGSDKSTVSLFHLESTGDRGHDTNETVLVDLNFDTTAGTAARTLRIDSEQTTGTVVEVDATEITTGVGLELAFDDRTTGKGLWIHDLSDTDNVGVLALFEQRADRTGNSGSMVVQINNATTANSASRTLKIDSEQTTGTVVEIDATEITTGRVLAIDADKLTTGKGIELLMDSRTTGTGLHVHDDSTTDSAGALVKIEQAGDRTGSAASIGVDINFDTTANENARTLRIDSEQTTGTVVEVDATEITTGHGMLLSASNLTSGVGLELAFDNRTTGKGLWVHDLSDTDNVGVLALFEQRADRTGNSGSKVVQINTATTANPASRALKIDSEQTTGTVVEIDATQLTTGEAIRVDADDLTTGTMLNLESNSSTTGTRALFKLTNDHTSATGTTLAHIKNDAIATGIETMLIESTAKDTNPVLELRNSNAGVDNNTTHTGFPATLNFNRSSDTTANDMGLGLITFQGKNSTDEEITYADILVRATDDTDTSEAGQITFRAQATDSPSQLRNVLTLGGQSAGASAETVFNEDAFDINFRVESNASDANENVTDGSISHLTHDSQYALFVDGANGRVGIGTGSPDTTLHIAGSAHIEGDLWVKGITNQIDTLVHVTSAMDIHNVGTGPALKVTQTGSQPVAVFMDDAVPALYIEDGGTGRSGYVGMGLSDPTQNLHVHRLGTANGDGSYLQLTTGDTGATASDGLHVGYDESNKAIINNKESTELEFKTNNTLAMMISGVGQHVAIGSSNAYTTLYVDATDGLRVPVGTTAQRPANVAYDITASNPDDTQYLPKLGTIRYNTDQKVFEGFGAGNQWNSIGGSGNVIDPDRDTYWTTVNDLDNLHDPGGTKYGTDEFNDTDYPGDVDYLRAFTTGIKRFAIASNGDSRWYFKNDGAGTQGDPYTYQTMLQITTSTNGVAVSNPTETKNVTIDTVDTSAATSGNSETPGDLQISAGDAGTSSIQAGQTGTNGGNITISAGKGGNVNTGSGGDGGSLTIAAGVGGSNPISVRAASGKINIHNDGGISIKQRNSANSTWIEMASIDRDGDADFRSLILDNALAMAEGGTGLSSVTSGNILYANAANSWAAAAPGSTSGVQPYDADLATIAGLAKTNGNFIVGDGSAWVVESGATARTSIGLGTGNNVQFQRIGVGAIPGGAAGSIYATDDIIAFYSVSDARLKCDVETIDDALSIVTNMRGVRFKYNDKAREINPEVSDRTQVGVIAQEVQEHLPEVIRSSISDEYIGVRYENMTAVLIEAVKQQQTQIELLKEQVELLRRQL